MIIQAFLPFLLPAALGMMAGKIWQNTGGNVVDKASGRVANALDKSIGTSKSTGELEAIQKGGFFDQARQLGFNPTWGGQTGGMTGQPTDGGEMLGKSEMQHFTGHRGLNAAQRSAIAFDVANKQLDLERKSLRNKALKREMYKYMPSSYLKHLI